MSADATQDRAAEFWQREADRYQSVYDWIAQNDPRTLELCPIKIVGATPDCAWSLRGQSGASRASSPGVRESAKSTPTHLGGNMTRAEVVAELRIDADRLKYDYAEWGDRLSSLADTLAQAPESLNQFTYELPEHRRRVFEELPNGEWVELGA